jgi:hypothetical protein
MISRQTTRPGSEQSRRRIAPFDFETKQGMPMKNFIITNAHRLGLGLIVLVCLIWAIISITEFRRDDADTEKVKHLRQVIGEYIKNANPLTNVPEGIPNKSWAIEPYTQNWVTRIAFTPAFTPLVSTLYQKPLAPITIKSGTDDIRYVTEGFLVPPDIDMGRSKATVGKVKIVFKHDPSKNVHIQEVRGFEIYRLTGEGAAVQAELVAPMIDLVPDQAEYEAVDAGPGPEGRGYPPHAKVRLVVCAVAQPKPSIEEDEATTDDPNGPKVKVPKTVVPKKDSGIEAFQDKDARTLWRSGRSKTLEVTTPSNINVVYESRPSVFGAGAGRIVQARFKIIEYEGDFELTLTKSFKEGEELKGTVKFEGPTPAGKSAIAPRDVHTRYKIKKLDTVTNECTLENIDTLELAVLKPGDKLYNIVRAATKATETPHVNPMTPTPPAPPLVPPKPPANATPPEPPPVRPPATPVRPAGPSGRPPDPGQSDEAPGRPKR